MLPWTLSQRQSLAVLCTLGRRSDPRQLVARWLCRCSHAHSTLAQQGTGLHAQATGRPDRSRPVTDQLEERRISGSKASPSTSTLAATRQEEKSRPVSGQLEERRKSGTKRPTNRSTSAATGRADSSKPVTDELGAKRKDGSGASTRGSTSAVPHIPVLLHEVLAAFRDQQIRVFVDGTLGAGGHTAAIVAEHPELQTLVGIDMDPTAHEIARRRVREAIHDGSGLLSMERFKQVQGNFGHLRRYLEAELGCNPDGSVDGLLLDLGMSSMQLDTAVRGFSHAKDGPLDMRMGPDARRSAEEIVNTWSELALKSLLHNYGELRCGGIMAEGIVRAREEAPIRTTGQLLAALGLTVSKAGSKKALLFQALRIAVNDELDALERALPHAIAALAPGGRLAVISFHSLEDRLVKWAFLRAAGRPTPGDEVHLLRWQLAAPQHSPALPAATCRIVTKTPLRPGKEEAARNPRARSAKLRVLEKLPVPDGSAADKL